MFFSKYKITIIASILVTTLPFLWLLSNIDFTLQKVNTGLFWSNVALVTGNVAGYIGAILLMWEFIYGIRQIIVLFSKDLNWVMQIHKWVGKYGMLLVFLHPILMLYAYAESIGWIFLPNLSTSSETQITYGRVGFLLFLAIYITSALVRGKIKYRPWLYIHYLSYPILGFTFLHAINLGTFLQEYLVLQIVWYSMILLFVIMCIYRLLTYAGIFSNKLQFINKEKVTNDVYYLTFKVQGKFPSITAGQYMYLQLKRFGEAHPFTVMEFNKDEKLIKFGVKELGSFTKKFAFLDEGNVIFADGPYGVFTLEGHNTKPKVILSGGIGVTPFIELAKKYGNESTYFINCNKNINNALYRKELKNLNSIKYFDVLSGEESSNLKENIFKGHIDSNILKSIVGNLLNEANYFICGSKRYTEGMKKILQESGVSKNKIFSEDFY